MGTTPVATVPADDPGFGEDGMESTEPAPVAAAPQESIRTRKIGQLKLTNVPMLEVLNFICRNAGLRQKVEDYAVTILPAGGNDVDLYQRTFPVPPGFLRSLSSSLGGGDDGGDTDPFGSGDSSSSSIKPLPSAYNLLKKAGVQFLSLIHILHAAPQSSLGVAGGKSRGIVRGGSLQDNHAIRLHGGARRSGSTGSHFLLHRCGGNKRVGVPFPAPCLESLYPDG